LHKPAYRRATQEMLRAVRCVFVRSESLRHALTGLTNSETTIATVRTGIPLQEFSFRTRTTPEGGEWRLMQAGRLIEKKGLATSIRAFAEFAKIFPASRFVIAGEGPLAGELQELARSLGIADKISFPGFLPQQELQKLLYESHIFLHPSQLGADGNQEGVPNSMLEAMASGLPVFATTHGGIPEAIESGLTGILVPEKDHAALAWRLIEAAQQPERLSQMAVAAAESVARNFDQRAQIENLEDLYLKIIETA
jgi:colanic acid/amylovoran biosynthesis glycosyltransferase